MPRSLSIALTLSGAVVLGFLATAPWRIGALSIRRWEVIFAFCVLTIAAALLSRSSRAYAGQILRSDAVIGRRALAIGFLLVSMFLLRAVFAKFHALEVNAWDFSISFDRPLERSLHGELLWSATLRQSMLGVHCNWLLLLFIPLYAIAASPYWLLVAQAMAVAGAALALFHFARAAAGDDFLAAVVALAFVVNRYTAHATQFVFIIDVFYPLGLFLLFYSFLTSKRRLFAIALLLVLSIKEDAIVPLIGFALVAVFGFRRWPWAAVAGVAAAAVFAVDYFVVLPGFGVSAAPWYAGYWASFGATPLQAIVGIASDPLRVISRAFSSSFDLLVSLAFVPLAGFEWLLAVVPPLIVYGSADAEKLHWLSMHYSLPLLPAMFAAVTYGALRLGRRFADPRAASRVVAISALVMSAVLGSTYEMDEPRPERALVKSMVQRAGSRPLFVQGALAPHAGYAGNVQPLHHDVPASPRNAYLLCTTCSPYPFTREELRARLDALRTDARYQNIEARDLVLFLPRR